jgi:DNA-directed RNA polymerase subunit alpha
MTFPQSVLLPNVVNFTEMGPNRARLVVEPAYPGYGVTLGNALRRVLLSSLPGAAIVAAKFHGVSHEFTVIEGVKEDVVDIVINLKKVKFTSFSAEPVKVKMKAKGVGVVTASAIDTGGLCEVANPDQPILTITDKIASVEAEFTVTSGLGFVPVEAREKQKLDIGEIAMDAWFSPVTRVGFDVEHVRVGEMVNFDRLTMDIETDGSLTPEDAVRKAARILVDHFTQLAGEYAPHVESIMTTVGEVETPKAKKSKKA